MVISGYKVNTVLKCGWTPLMYAASSALPQIVKFLIDNGADPHSHKGIIETQNQETTTEFCMINCCFDEYNMNSVVLDIACNKDLEINEQMYYCEMVLSILYSLYFRNIHLAYILIKFIECVFA